MGINNDRGRQFEDLVARMTRAKIDKAARRNAGSHANWHRRSDIYTELPLHIEAKDHETIKIKEWFRQADDAASFGRAPVVVYHDDENVMAVLRYDDLLNFMVEIADQKAEIEDLRQYEATPIIALNADQIDDLGGIKTKYEAKIAVNKKTERIASFCRAGHISDVWGYCMQVKCQYSRGYKKPKEKKKNG